MKRFFALLLLILVQNSSVVGQRSRAAMGKPIKFIQCHINDQRLEQADLQRLSDRPWIVYVVNSSAQFYNDLSGAISSYKANFMEKLVVLEVRNDYLRLIKDDQIAIDGILSRNYTEVGWIHQDNLLLSDFALRGNDSRVIPAFICDNVELRKQKQGPLFRLEETSLKVYKDPMLSIISENPVYDGEYYFVYKTTKSAILIGKKDRVDASNYADVLLGWISIDNAYVWESRIAVEPNWEPESAFERKEKAIYAQLFLDIISAVEFSKGKRIDPEYRIWAADLFEKRFHGRAPRFPVKAISNNILRISVFGIKSNEISSENLASNNNVHILVNQQLDNTSFFLASEQMAPVKKTEPMNTYVTPRIRCIAAYAPLYHAELANPMFRFVILLSRSEIQRLVDFYNALRLAAQDEKTLYQFLKQRLLQLNIDLDKDQDTLDQWTVNQAFYALIGSSLNQKAYANLKLGDLNKRGEKDTDNEFFEAFLSSVENSLSRLEPYVKNTDQGLSFISNQTAFFWVPYLFML